MEDELAFDAEAMGEDDAAVDGAAQKREAFGGRQGRRLVAANALRDIEHAALNAQRHQHVKSEIEFVFFHLLRMLDATADAITTMPFQY